MNNTIDLSTERLQVRHLLESDVDAFHAYRSLPEVAQYQGFDVMNAEQCRIFIHSQQDRFFGEPGQWLQCALVQKTTGELIGDCALKLHEDDPQTAGIGITISPIHQRQGYAQEAMIGLLDWLFYDQDVRRVVETVDAENEASIMLLNSIGFRREGYFIENAWYKGKLCSEYQYALLKREWEERRAGLHY